jgi:tetratricopeptide (TPR) repeat protein
LKELNDLIRSNPDSIDLYFRRAALLCELDRLVECRNDYLTVLRLDPRHKVAWAVLGSLLVATGQREAAEVAYKEAVTQNPNDTSCRINYGNFLLEESEYSESHEKYTEAVQRKRDAQIQFDHALEIDSACEKAHEGLSYLFADLGEAQLAAHHRKRAFQNRHVIPMPYRGEDEPVTVLQVVSTLGGNVRFQPFLDDRVFKTVVVVPEFYDSRKPLPPHDLVINGIGDAEVARGALLASEQLLKHTSAPVLNPIKAVLSSTRSNNAARLSGLPGVVAPNTLLLPREKLLAQNAAQGLASAGIQFPLLLRAPGFHTGRYFRRVDTFDDLPSALEQIPGPDIIAMQYLDARGADGKSRKYRAMMIGGKLYPLHLAISSHWKIHYFTAEMADHADHRKEDEAYLEDMPRAIGPLAMKALAHIQRALCLDYAGIDFGLNDKGKLLLFEANATMLVAVPGSHERWNYRRPAYNKICAAVRNMILEKARNARTPEIDSK